MRILIDECVPRRLKQYLGLPDVFTVKEVGWAGKKNGELLTLMEQAGFDVLVTVDQNLSYQQNIAARSLALVVLVAPTSKLSTLIPLLPSARKAIAHIQLGKVVEITS